MSSPTAAKPVAVPDPEPEPQSGVTYLTIRGTVYRIEELSQEDYENAQRKAEIPDKDNEGSTTTDMLVLERLVTLSSVTIVEKEGDPAGSKLDAEAWAKEKFPVTSRVSYEVRRAHFMALTDQQIAQIEEQSKGKNPNG